LSVIFDPLLSPSGGIPNGASNITMARWKLHATNENIKINELKFKVNTSVLGGLKNVKVFYNGTQIGLSQDLIEDTDTLFSFGSSLIIPSNTSGVLEIRADVYKSDGGVFNVDDTILITLVGNTNNAIGLTTNTIFNAPLFDSAANELTVSQGGLTITKYVAYGNQNFALGSQSVKVGSAVLTASNEGAVNITNLTVSSSVLTSSYIANMYLKDGGTQIGSVKQIPEAVNNFTVNLVIPSSGSKVIDIYADIKSDAQPGNIYFSLSAQGPNMVSNDALLQMITIVIPSLTAAADASKPDADIVLAGTSKVLMNAIKFTAQYEDFEVQELTFTADSGIQPHVGAVTLEYPVQGGGTGTAVGYMASGTVTFTGLTMFVARDNTAVLKVYIDVPALSSGTISGGTGSINWDVSATYKHVGKGSGLTETTGTNVSASNINGNDMVVRKTRPTVTLVGLPTTVLGAGTQVISKFTVAADAKGSVELSTLTWTTATSGSVTLSSPALYVSGNPTALSASSTAFTASGLKISLTTPEQIAAASSKTYELKATIGGTITTGDNVQTRLVTDSATQTGTINALIGSRLFIWSDMSAVPHSTGSADWASGLYVKTLPSDLQTLQK